MANPSVTYTFTNSTTADGTQVSQNFTDLINGMTDGTKSFSIDALTVAGTALFNGPVTLGNATGDTITIGGYFSGSIIGSTTAGVPWKGATDGSAASAGYIGEEKYTSSTSTITQTTPTGSTWYDTGLTITTTNGNWVLAFTATAKLYYSAYTNGGVGVTVAICTGTTGAATVIASQLFGADHAASLIFSPIGITTKVQGAGAVYKVFFRTDVISSGTFTVGNIELRGDLTKTELMGRRVF